MSVKEPAQRPAGRPRAISSPTPISISKVTPYGRLWILWRRNWMLGMANQYWSPWAPSWRETKDRSWHGRNAACCLHSRQPFTPHCNRHLYQFTGRTSGPPLQCAYQKYFKCWNSWELKHVPWTGSGWKNPGTFWCHPCAKPRRSCHELCQISLDFYNHTD